MCSDAEVSRFGASSYRFLKTVTRYSKKTRSKGLHTQLVPGLSGMFFIPCQRPELNRTELTVSTLPTEVQNFGLWLYIICAW